MLIRTMSTVAEDIKQGRPCQNGLRYRTTCADCNNKWLEQYDRSLAKLYHGMLDKLDREPRAYWHTQTIQPQQIARTVIGHLMAANAVSLTEKFSVHEGNNKALHDYFFDENAPLPDNIDIYCWYYPSKTIKALNYIGSSFQLGNPNARTTGHILKFFPLAFWVVLDKPEGFNVYIPKLLQDKQLPIDGEERLTISCNPHPDLTFPELPHPKGQGFSLYASDVAVEAVQK